MATGKHAQPKKPKKRKLSSAVPVLAIVLGIVLLLYPTVSDWWNSRTQSYVVDNYESTLASMDSKDFSAMFEKADAYNAALRKIPYPLMYYASVPGYQSLLDVSGTGVMGYISIPKIGVRLPIYHGTSDAVLASAAGHVQGTSLPVGGPSTHAVISAHRGLPSAKLFTQLDRLEVGDTFTITVLDRVLTYQVDQIVVVEPDDVTELAVVEGEDYCTLLTCTPYGINTHRLLVRGTRVETVVERTLHVASDAYRVEPYLTAPFIAIPILLVLLVVFEIEYGKWGKKDSGGR